MGCCGKADPPPALEAQMASKWGTLVETSSHIFTWTTVAELGYLAELASKAQFIVESGCYLGRSAKVMLDANKQCHLWTVDKFMVAGTEHTTRFFLHDEIREGRCEIIVGDSEKALEMLGPHMAGKVDLVWVDDGHAEEDVMRDIRCLSPLLRPGGIMVGHDWEGDNDVARGVKRSGVPYTIPLPRIWQYVR